MEHGTGHPCPPLMVVGSWGVEVWRGRAAGRGNGSSGTHRCVSCAVEVLLDLMNAGELVLPQSAVPAAGAPRLNFSR